MYSFCFCLVPCRYTPKQLSHTKNPPRSCATRQRQGVTSLFFSLVGESAWLPRNPNRCVTTPCADQVLSSFLAKEQMSSHFRPVHQPVFTIVRGLKDAFRLHRHVLPILLGATVQASNLLGIIRYGSIPVPSLGNDAFLFLNLGTCHTASALPPRAIHKSPGRVLSMLQQHVDRRLLSHLNHCAAQVIPGLRKCGLCRILLATQATEPPLLPIGIPV